MNPTGIYHCSPSTTPQIKLLERIPPIPPIQPSFLPDKQTTAGLTRSMKRKGLKTKAVSIHLLISLSKLGERRKKTAIESCPGLQARHLGHDEGELGAVEGVASV